VTLLSTRLDTLYGSQSASRGCGSTVDFRMLEYYSAISSLDFRTLALGTATRITAVWKRNYPSKLLSRVFVFLPTKRLRRRSTQHFEDSSEKRAGSRARRVRGCDASCFRVLFPSWFKAVFVFIRSWNPSGSAYHFPRIDHDRASSIWFVSAARCTPSPIL